MKLVFNDTIMRINSVVYGRLIAGWYTFSIWLQLTCIYFVDDDHIISLPFPIEIVLFERLL